MSDTSTTPLYPVDVTALLKMGEQVKAVNEQFAATIAPLIPLIAEIHEQFAKAVTIPLAGVGQSLGSSFTIDLNPVIHVREYVEASIASFDADAPDSDYQRGYLAALKAVRDEAFSD